MEACLTIEKDGEKLQEQKVGDQAVLGRADGCDIRLDDRAISRKHAVIRNVDQGYQIEKQSHFAPLLVNGEDCTSAVLKEGDVVAIGPYLIKVGIQNETETSTDSDSEEELAKTQIIYSDEEGNTEEFENEKTEKFTPLEGTNNQSHVDLSVADQVLPVDQKMDSPKEDFSPEKEEEIEKSPIDGLPGVSPGSGEHSISLSGNEQPLELDVKTPEKSHPTIQPLDGESQDEDLELDPIQADFTRDLEKQMGDGESSQGLGIPESGLESPSDPVITTDLSTSAFGTEGSNNPTRAISVGKLNARLVVISGQTNLSELQIEGDTCVLGRGKNSNLILGDKKASRQHAIITRSGVHFTIKDGGKDGGKDSESANGTFVNGVRIREKDLASGDVIRIGDTEIRFEATSVDYEKKQHQFMSIPEEITDANTSIISTSHQPSQGTSSLYQGAMPPAGPPPIGSQKTQAFQNIDFGQTGYQPVPPPSGPGASLGIPTPPNPPKRSLLQRMRNHPKRREMILIITVITLGWFMMDDDLGTSPQKSKKVAKSSTSSPIKSYSNLSANDKKFVDSQQELALSYYKAKEYDKALFELRKILEMLPNYEPAKEIERYAQEAKRRIELAEEVRKKKEEEVRIKKEVKRLVAEVKELMRRKSYQKANALFPQILALDPENKDVGQWQVEIRTHEEKKQRERDRQLAQAKINKNGWSVYDEAMKVRSAGDRLKAVRILQEILDLGATDRKLIDRVRSQIQSILSNIKSEVDPLLQQAKDHEAAGEFAQAFKLYEKASEIDPREKQAVEGMNRIRGTLNEKAKIAYTQAVIAESYSDFDTAKKKFEECLEIAPKDDIYYGRAKRKLSRFKRFEAGVSQ